MTNKIGSGGYAEVYEADWFGEKVAVKVLEEEHKVRELLIAKCAKHENVVQTREIMKRDSDDATLLVMELCGNGSLHSAIKNGEFKGNMPKVLSTLMDVAKGMKYLNDSGIVHGDLKSKNIVLTEDFVAKITDFGQSRRFLGEVSEMIDETQRGTPAFMPPELLDEGRITSKCDVYSFGMIMYELATGRAPLSKYNQMQISFQVPNMGLRPSFEDCDNVPVEFQNLAKACWEEDVESRPTCEDIIRALTEMME